jgi:tetratricopeptide (TPR) repeat protein
VQLGHIPEAISNFSAILEVDPGWADVQFVLGRCLLGQPGRRDEALKHLQEAVHLNPNNKVWQTVLQDALGRP